MKCYLINLDRSSDRLQFMSGQFGFLKSRASREDGIDLVRVPAIDARTLDDAEAASYYDRDFYSFNARYFPNIVPKGGLSKAEIACFLSHRECWRRIAESGEAFGAVFEDDVVFSSEAAFFLEDGAWIPAGADIVKLEVMTDRFVGGRLNRQNFRGREVVRFHSVNMGAAAYIVSGAAAFRLLEMTRTFYLPVDHVLFDDLFPFFRSLKCYQLVPALCIQEGQLNGETGVFKSTLSSDDPEFSRSARRERPALGIRLKRELKRAFYHLRSRAGFRGSVRNAFPREEAFALPEERKKTD